MRSNSAVETFEAGRSFAARLRSGDVVAMDGDLGAGKTHFVKGIAAGLDHWGEVTSPTFTLVHEYTGGRIPLFHFDFYRLESEEEVLGIGLDDYLDRDGILAIEWAGKFPALLPANALRLKFRAGEGDERVIEIL